MIDEERQDEEPQQPEEEQQEAEQPQEPEAEQPQEEAPEPAAESPEPEEPAAETPAPEEPAAESPAPEEPAAESPAPEEPAVESPAPEEPSAESPEPEEPAAESPEPEADAEPAPPAEEAPPRPKRGRGKSDDGEEEVIPGLHLEPDLVLEEEREETEYPEYAGAEAAEEAVAVPQQDGAEEPGEPEPVAREPLDLAADARYAATGKRKSAVARVILKPGDGTYQINGRHLDEFFPRIKLQRMARQPLEVAGYGSRMDVNARIHGGGVAAQAGALRHGIARALVEADPNLRIELKRRGYLTRDPRVKERKKAGLKKARKRPQFSKR
ncbi:MAG: 30S ribosomal protein S9 [Thermoleophilaceae bacterium]